MCKAEFQATQEIVASTPAGPIVEFCFRGEDEVSRGDKIGTFLKEHIEKIQPAATLLNFLECKQLLYNDFVNMTPAFIDPDLILSRPCAVLAKGRGAEYLKGMLWFFEQWLGIKVFDDRDSAVTYLRGAIRA